MGTAFAVDQVLRVSSLRVELSFAIYGARLQRTMMVTVFLGSSAVYLYRNTQYSEEILKV
jgi:hypothetical protein